MGRTTYIEHEAHGRHGARDPVTDVLVEGIGTLQHSNGRMAARSERQCVEGAGDGEKGMGRTTYVEHVAHIGHRARVPVTDGLVEGTGKLQHSDGRMAARSERQCVEGAGDGEKVTGRNTYKKHLPHGRHARRARRGQLGLVDSSHQHNQTSLVALRVCDAVNHASVSHARAGTQDGHAVGSQVKSRRTLCACGIGGARACCNIAVGRERACHTGPRVCIRGGGTWFQDAGIPALRQIVPRDAGIALALPILIEIIIWVAVGDERTLLQGH